MDFSALFDWFKNTFLQIFKDLWEFFTDIPVWIFDGLYGLVVTALSGIEFEVPDLGDGFGALPAEMLNVLGLLGLGEALAIIGIALVVRFVLQLIPFVRLGS